MIDFITKHRITVQGEPLAGAHLIVPVEQWAAAREALDRGGVKYWVGDEPIVVRDDPPVLWVGLSRSSDATHVQRILDAL